MRATIYHIIERGNHSTLSKIYDCFIIITILFSLLPMAFKKQTELLMLIEYTSFFIFIVDYLIRWATADFKLKKGKISFLLYPLSFLALLDLVCLLPYFAIFNPSLKLLKLFRMARALRVLKIFPYSKNVQIILNVLREQRDSLVIVGILSLGYILLSSLLIFNLEPDTFENYFEAVYWATISLTTVGYGDIYAVSATGKLITMISALFGTAIVALPAGIITAGYIKEVSRFKE